MVGYKGEKVELSAALQAPQAAWPFDVTIKCE